MAKRFTDSEKWKKGWFRKLNPIHKCLWVYICDSCNTAGIWDVDFELAEIFIGAKLDPQEIKNVFIKQYKELNSGNKWFIKDFISFQYGELVENNNFHKSVVALLKKAGVFEGLTSPSSGAMVKDKVKVKVKDNKGVVKGKMRHLEFVLLSPAEYTKLIEEFGKEGTEDRILQLNNYIGSKGDKYKSHYHTILNWAYKNNPKPKIALTKQQASNLRQLEDLRKDGTYDK